MTSTFIESILKLMKIENSLVQILKTGLAILLLLLFCTHDAAYARGGCFSGDTRISTPQGYKHIDQLHKHDHIVGYKLNTHQSEEEEIGEIKVIHSPDYFLINGTVKVTGTHPFYVRRNSGLDIGHLY